jgi:hypothetical protein
MSQQHKKNYYIVHVKHDIDYEGSVLDDVDEYLYDNITQAKDGIKQLIKEWNNRTDTFNASVYRINTQEKNVTLVYEKTKRRPKYYQSQGQSSQQQYQTR